MMGDKARAHQAPGRLGMALMSLFMIKGVHLVLVWHNLVAGSGPLAGVTYLPIRWRGRDLLFVIDASGAASAGHRYVPRPPQAE